MDCFDSRKMCENRAEKLFLESSDDPPTPKDDKDPLFKERESILTTHFASLTDHRVAYNWILAHLIAYFILHCVNYVLNSDDWDSDVKFVQKVFHHFDIALGLGIFLFLWSLFQWFLQTKYEHSRVGIVHICIGIVAWIIFITIPILVRLRFDMGFVLSTAVSMEQLRVTMKMYSFLVETGEQSQNRSATISQFIYFWFAPTLLYRSSYPRSKNRSWLRCLVYFLEFLACCFIGGCLFRRLILDGIGNPKNHPLRVNDLPKILVQIMLTATCTLLLTWYGFLHCWLNGWAEALRFGDRSFYGSWWLCRSFLIYFRLWNKVVHQWLKTYIHLPLRKKFGPGLSSSLTLIVSLIAHEYFVCYALGGFLPVMGLFFLSGLTTFFFPDKISTKKQGSISNLTLLFGKTFGWMTMITNFGLEGYSRSHCPVSDQDSVVWNFFVPRFFKCIKFVE